MAFVITDGKQTKTGSYTPLGLAAKPLRNMGVQMVAIGVGKRNVVDARELLEIAGQDNYVYVIESFEELQNPGQAKIFRQRVCQGEHQVLHALSQNNFSMFTSPEWDVRSSQAFPLPSFDVSLTEGRYLRQLTPGWTEALGVTRVKFYYLVEKKEVIIHNHVKPNIIKKDL